MSVFGKQAYFEYAFYDRKGYKQLSYKGMAETRRVMSKHDR